MFLLSTSCDLRALRDAGYALTGSGLRVAGCGLRGASCALPATRTAVLEPALNDDFGIRKEIKNFLAVRFGVAEHRVSGTAEGEETHRSGNTDVDSDHAR